MSATEGTGKFCIFDLEVDFDARTVRRAGRDIVLTPREFDLLQFLIKNRGEVVARNTIRAHLYSSLKYTSNVIDVYIRHLREKLDPDVALPLILTFRGSGYMFRAEPRPAIRSEPPAEAEVGPPVS